MATQTLTLEVPEPLYQRLKKRADHARRSAEEESVQLLSASVPGADLPDDLAAALASLLTMDELKLWNAAHSRLPAETSDELVALNGKQQREGLRDADHFGCGRKRKPKKESRFRRADRPGSNALRGLARPIPGRLRRAIGWPLSRSHPTSRTDSSGRQIG
jgi:plasmid stability protein